MPTPTVALVLSLHALSCRPNPCAYTYILALCALCSYVVARMWTEWKGITGGGGGGGEAVPKWPRLIASHDDTGGQPQQYLKKSDSSAAGASRPPSVTAAIMRTRWQPPGQRTPRTHHIDYALPPQPTHPASRTDVHTMRPPCHPTRAAFLRAHTSHAFFPSSLLAWGLAPSLSFNPPLLSFRFALPLSRLRPHGCQLQHALEVSVTRLRTQRRGAERASPRQRWRTRTRSQHPGWLLDRFRSCM